MRELLLIQIRPQGASTAQHEQDCVTRRFGDRAHRLRPRNVFEERPDASWLEGVDGVIIGGSGNFSVHDPRSEEWVTPLRGLLGAALERRTPGFGLCFGHQLMGLHLGAEIVTDRGRMESGTIDFALERGGQDDPVFGYFGQLGHAHTGHTDHVVQVPRGATLLASTARSPVQAMRVDGTGWWTTQFHPDLARVEAVERFSAFADAIEADGQPRPDSPDYTEHGDRATSLLGAWYDTVF